MSTEIHYRHVMRAIGMFINRKIFIRLASRIDKPKRCTLSNDFSIRTLMYCHDGRSKESNEQRIHMYFIHTTHRNAYTH